MQVARHRLIVIIAQLSSSAAIYSDRRHAVLSVCPSAACANPLNCSASGSSSFCANIRDMLLSGSGSVCRTGLLVTYRDFWDWYISLLECCFCVCNCTSTSHRRFVLGLSVKFCRNSWELHFDMQFPSEMSWFVMCRATAALPDCKRGSWLSCGVRLSARYVCTLSARLSVCHVRVLCRNE